MDWEKYVFFLEYYQKLLGLSLVEFFLRNESRGRFWAGSLVMFFLGHIIGIPDFGIYSSLENFWVVLRWIFGEQLMKFGIKILLLIWMIEISTSLECPCRRFTKIFSNFISKMVLHFWVILKLILNVSKNDKIVCSLYTVKKLHYKNFFNIFISCRKLSCEWIFFTYNFPKTENFVTKFVLRRAKIQNLKKCWEFQNNRMKFYIKVKFVQNQNFFSLNFSHIKHLKKFVNTYILV